MATLAELLLQAKTCYSAGDLHGAADWYRQAVHADPLSVEAYYSLGATCHRLGQVKEAIACLAQAAQFRPDLAELHLYLGAALAADARLDEAVPCFRRAVELRPDFADAHRNLGAALTNQGRFDEAVVFSRRAVELNPNDALAQNNLAAVLKNLGIWDEAAACCQRALAMQPAFAGAHNNLGTVLEQQGHLAEAEACYRRAGELDPNLADAHSNLGAVVARQDRATEAVASYRRALELRPGDPEVHNKLGKVLAGQGLLAEAVASYRRALELRPNHAEAHNNLGVQLERQGSIDEAVACYRRALELKPDFAEAYTNLGSVFVAQDRLAEAADCCRRALQLMPEIAEAHNNLAAVLEKQGHLTEAAASCRRALSLKPDFAEAHLNLAAILMGQEQLAEAEACCRRALQLKPEHAQASLNLGAVLTQQGRVAEAKECYLAALEHHLDQDTWRLNILSLCPIILSSSREIELYRRRLLEELEEFSKKELGSELPPQLTSAGTPSFNLQFHGFDERPTREAYARIFRHCFPAETPVGSRGRPRIGLVVTDRHEGLFIRSLGGVLDRINPDKFELVVVGSERGIALIRSYLTSPTIEFMAAPTNLVEMAAQIRSAQFDVLYYWEVGTDIANYLLPFLRLAPVQCTSWGVQVTSGIPALDYYLSNELVEAEDASSHYTEKLILARTLLTYQRRVAAPPGGKTRADFGIESDRHLYLCAQQLGKFHPDFDPLLAEILRRDRQGVLAITEGKQGGHIAEQLRQRFAATMGDVVDRIVFVPVQPTPDYLSLVAGADVLLDPLHFGGVNTTYDGLSLNKPIVTLPSRFQRGRYTLACYKKMGVLDCVAASPERYIEIAVALGTEPAFLADMVEKIRRASPVLFEDIEAVREHERIFGELIGKSRLADRIATT